MSEATQDLMRDDPWAEFGKPAQPGQIGETVSDDDEDIFGDVDINEVSDNPFDVADGTYPCVLSSAKISRKEGEETRWLKLEWKINDPESEYDKMTLREQHKLPPRGLKFKEMDHKAQQSLKFFKMRLRQAFDMSETQLSTFKPRDLIDKEAMVTVEHNQGTGDNSDKTYVNVKTALSMREFAERQAKRTSAAQEAAKSVGL